MIRHDHERMQLIMPQHIGVVADCLHDHVSEHWPVKMERSGEGFVEQAIQGGEGLSGGYSGGWESSIRRQTAVKIPGEEGYWRRLIEVRKSPAVEGHAEVVGQARGNSQE